MNSILINTEEYKDVYDISELYTNDIFRSLQELYDIVGKELNTIMAFINCEYIIHMSIDRNFVVLKITSIKAFWRKYSNIYLRYVNDMGNEVCISMEHITLHTVKRYKKYIILPYNRDIGDIYHDEKNGIINIGTPLLFTKISYDISDINIILKYLKKIVNNNELMYKYLINWLAHIIKYPAHKTKKALYIYGTNNSEKLTIVKLIESLLGTIHCITLDKIYRLFNKFNHFLNETTIIHFENPTWSKNKRTRELNSLIDLISNDTIELHIKGSNEEIVTATNRDYINDINYFVIRFPDNIENINEVLKNKDTMNKLYSYLMDINIDLGSLSN